jgi:hypothetical protein
MATLPQAPKLWRSTRTDRAPSIDSSFPSVEGGYTFGLKAPIVDFFGHDYITKFATLEDVLLGKADEIMNEAYKVDPTEEDYIPFTAGGYNFRWIRKCWGEPHPISDCFVIFAWDDTHSRIVLYRAIANPTIT